MTNVSAGSTHDLRGDLHQAGSSRIRLYAVPGARTLRSAKPRKVAAQATLVSEERGLGLTRLLVVLLRFVDRPPKALAVRDEPDLDP